MKQNNVNDDWILTGSRVVNCNTPPNTQTRREKISALPLQLSSNKGEILICFGDILNETIIK